VLFSQCGLLRGEQLGQTAAQHVELVAVALLMLAKAALMEGTPPSRHTRQHAQHDWLLRLRWWSRYFEVDSAQPPFAWRSVRAISHRGESSSTVPSVQRVLVTVKREEEGDGRDLEVPAEIPATELTQLIGQALGWPDGERDLRIRVEPNGQILGEDESLLGAGTPNGAWLVFAAAPATEPPLDVPESAAWPPFLSSRAMPAERRLPVPLLAVGAAVLILLALVVVSTRPAAIPTPAPTAVPTPVPPPPTALPAVQPVALPTVMPTPLPTSPPPTALPSPTAPPRPTIAATTVVQDATTLWPALAAQLDPLWGRDWPRAIELTEGFLARFPNYAPAADKLYGA
jgi:hypothetical protein